MDKFILNDDMGITYLGGHCPLSNYYGGVFVGKFDDKYIMAINDWDNCEAIFISEEFFNAWMKEFGAKND